MKYIGTARHKQNILLAKRDIVEIMKIAARFVQKTGNEEIKKLLMEVKAGYDKL